MRLNKFAVITALLVLTGFPVFADIITLSATGEMSGYTSALWLDTENIKTNNNLYAHTIDDMMPLYTEFNNLLTSEIIINSVKIKVVHYSAAAGDDDFTVNVTNDSGTTWAKATNTWDGTIADDYAVFPMNTVKSTAEADITGLYASWNKNLVDSIGAFVRVKVNGINDFTAFYVDHVYLEIDYEVPTKTITPTVSETITLTVTQTVTQTATPTASNTQTITGTVTMTDTETMTETATQSITLTATASVTATVTETITSSITGTVTQTVSQTVTETMTQTVTETITQTITKTATQSITHTITQTITGSITLTVTETITSTTTQTITPTVTGSITQTVTQSVTETITQTNTPTVTITPTFQLIISSGPANPAGGAVNFDSLVTVLQVRFTATGGPVSVGELQFAGAGSINWVDHVVPGSVAIYNDNGTTAGILDGSDSLIRGNQSFFDPFIGPVNFSGSPGLFVVAPGTPVNVILVFKLRLPSGMPVNFIQGLLSGAVVAHTYPEYLPMSVFGSVSGMANGNSFTVNPPTLTVTGTVTETATQSVTPTVTGTATTTVTSTITKTDTETVTQTVTGTITQTVTQTITQTNTQTTTGTVTQTVTPTVTQTVTETATQTITQTNTQTVTETITQTMTETITQTITGTMTGTVTQTITQTNTLTVTATITETSTPTSTSTPSAYLYVIPVQAVAGNEQAFEMRFSARAGGPITSLRIITPFGGTITGGLSVSHPDASVGMSGSDIMVTYAPGFTNTDDPNFDTIRFNAILTESPSVFIGELNSLAGVNASVPSGFTLSVIMLTPTVTRTVTQTMTQTVTESSTPSITQTVTQTVTATNTQTITQTVTETITQTNTETVTQTVTATNTQTITQTATETITQTITETATKTITQTITQTVTQSVTGTVTGTITETITQTVTSSITATVTPTATETVTATVTGTATQSMTLTVTATVTETVTNTITKTVTLTVTQTVTTTATQTVTQTTTQTATGTITLTATQTITQTVTQTVTQTISPTVTPTNTPIISLLVLAPGETPASSFPGYTGTPVVQEAGRPVNFTVMLIEQNNWTKVPAANLISMSSSQPGWTIVEAPKQLVSGEATFTARFLRPDIAYVMTAHDEGGIFADAQSRVVPVTTTAVGNTALIGFSAPVLSTVRRGERDVHMMNITVTNPNAGPGPVYLVQGITITARQSGSAVENVIAYADAVQVNSSAVTGNTAYVQLGVTVNPGETMTLGISVDVRPDAPQGTFETALESLNDLIIEKPGDIRVLNEPVGAAVPFVSDRLNVIAEDLKSTFYNYPNPFAAGTEKTNVQYFLPSDSDVSIDIMDITGRKVRQLVKKVRQQGGLLYKLEWDGKNDAGTVVMNGIYYCVIKAGNETAVTKIAVVK